MTLNPCVSYRYIGTENGVFKVFPGTLVPDILYDPREDRWYTAAVGQSQKYMFITHPNQNTSIVTLAKAFHQTRYTHFTHQSRQMYKIISTLYTICLYKVHSYSQSSHNSTWTWTFWITMTWALHQARCMYDSRQNRKSIPAQNRNKSNKTAIRIFTQVKTHLVTLADLSMQPNNLFF